ncbi:DUF6458 family protein [Aeromicrobium sp. CTD01-1L150]|uniref:DUF6458 family protein n=1 Tax=Aeromicrobium sp. CTD01-1L150 TaxID=3341830 RepID=UPI0035BFB78A
MSLGATLFLIAIGAVLAYAVDPDVVSWIDISIVGFILMVVGAVGLVLALVQQVQSRR